MTCHISWFPCHFPVISIDCSWFFSWFPGPWGITLVRFWETPWAAALATSLATPWVIPSRRRLGWSFRPEQHTHTHQLTTKSRNDSLRRILYEFILIIINMYLGHVMKAIWKRGSFLQRAVGNTKATLFSLKRPQEFLVTQPSCPSWWSSCQPWRASCHCPLCKWLWANEKAWNTLVGVQLEHFCQCGAVRLKSVSLWERCLLKTGPPATVVKNTFVWRRKCSQLSRICFFGGIKQVWKRLM